MRYPPPLYFKVIKFDAGTVQPHRSPMCPRLELFSTVFCELKTTVSRDFRHFFLNQKTTWTPYKQATTVLRNFSLLRRYSRKTGVGVVNDYADTDKTTRTFSENFEGFSQILKEQSGEKRYLVVFSNPIAII